MKQRSKGMKQWLEIKKMNWKEGYDSNSQNKITQQRKKLNDKMISCRFQIIKKAIFNFVIIINNQKIVSHSLSRTQKFEKNRESNLALSKE
jgi:hypothetical protein